MKTNSGIPVLVHSEKVPFPDQTTAAVAASLLDGVPGLPGAATCSAIAEYMAAAHMAVIAQNARCGEKEWVLHVVPAQA